MDNQKDELVHTISLVREKDAGNFAKATIWRRPDCFPLYLASFSMDRLEWHNDGKRRETSTLFDVHEMPCLRRLIEVSELWIKHATKKDDWTMFDQE